MKIERVINIFKKNKDKLFKEINADDLSVEILQTIFIAAEDDPYFYRPYKVEDSRYLSLIKYKIDLTDYSPADFDIYIEAHSI